MPKPHCQHCRSSLEYFSPVCPYCQGPILAASAIDFLGASVAEGLRLSLDSEPKLVRKKTGLYLKLCRSFICDSELALLNVRGRLGEPDRRSRLAIEDVLASHREHLRNLGEFLNIMAEKNPWPALTLQILSLCRRLQSLLAAWEENNFGAEV